MESALSLHNPASFCASLLLKASHLGGEGEGEGRRRRKVRPGRHFTGKGKEECAKQVEGGKTADRPDRESHKALMPRKVC